MPDDLVTSLNHTLFLALNAATEPSGPLLWLALASAKYLFLLVPLHMALAWFAGDREVREVAIAGLLALVVAFFFRVTFCLVFYTPRPSAIGLGHAWIDHRPSAAFPSNHAIVCFTWAAALAIFRRPALAAAAAVIGLAVAWSRIFLGVHFPLDMGGAALVGCGSAVLSAWLVQGYGSRLLTLAEDMRRHLPRRPAGGRAA